MKKETLQERADIVNKSLYYIYKNIETDITLEELAKLNSISKFHFHRIFKEEMKKNFSDCLTSIRLQKAANMLISNPYSSITEISNLCGYSSHSSFIKAFKKKYTFTPSQWKKGSYKDYSKTILNDQNIINLDLEASIQVREKTKCLYIRHKGYNKELKHTWQRLRALAYELEIENYDEIGVHHDNPSITPLNDCSYVAAITINDNIKINKKVSSFEIPKSLCAVFNYKGQYGDIINVIRYIHQEWIIDKGYEITTLPCFIKYHKNHLTQDSKDFHIEINIPIRVI